MSRTIRLGVEADVSRIVRIHRNARLSAYVNDSIGATREFVLRDYINETTYRDQMARWHERVAKNGDGHQLEVMDIGGLVVGFCLAIEHPEENEIAYLHVDPEHHRQRIGWDLLASGLRHLGDSKPARLDVVTYNYKAQALYEKYGFEIDIDRDMEKWHDGVPTPTGDRLYDIVMVRPAGIVLPVRSH